MPGTKLSMGIYWNHMKDFKTLVIWAREGTKGHGATGWAYKKRKNYIQHSVSVRRFIENGFFFKSIGF